MKIKISIFLFFILFLGLISCSKKQELQNISAKNNKAETQNKIYEKVILCDSVYENKNYQITLRFFSEEKSYDEGDKNTVFIFSKKENGKYKELMRDSIQSHFGRYEFEDFNGDKIKDILIQNISDVRSNWTYYLYLVDLKNDKLTKIKNFDKIKNPHYLPKYNLIDNEVMSGRNWTSFYQIQKDTVFDFGYVIYQGEDENGIYSDLNKEYPKTLSKVLKNKNYK